VLPDFQRGFAWRDKNKQKALIASVLTKLPIGTVLFLDVGAEDYGYKKIGRNERNIISLEGDKTVRALLDGQQRITTLIAFFSTKLQEKEDLVSPTLNRRYFLNLPSLSSVMEDGVEDIFGGSRLKFPVSLESGNYPKVSSEDVRSQISFVEDKKDFLYKNVKNMDTTDLCNYCRDISNSEKGNSYLIPLYYLLEANESKEKEDGSVECSDEYTILEEVIDKIGEEYKSSLIRWFQNDKNSLERKKEWLDKMELKENGKQEIINFLEKREISNLREYLEKLLLESKSKWVQRFLEYLRNCIKDIKLYEIKVEANDKDRAVDIYENLNLGGKSLSVFDLILAKSSKDTDEKKEGNLMTQIVNYIEEDSRKDYEVFIQKCGTNQKNSYKNNIEDKHIEYSASNRLGCWNEKNQELASGYIKALMNLLGIINYFSQEGELDLESQKLIKEANPKIVKKEYLLNIDSSKINSYIKSACKGLDRACAFLQIRCGIRRVGEIHYNLMWSILGTVFLKKEWFQDETILNYMEAWYWSAILSGEFKIEQNRAFIQNLQKVLMEVNTLQSDNPKKDFVISLCEGVLKDKKFADKDILLMKNPSVYPEKVISNTICQYYLSDTYRDILKEVPNQDGYRAEELEALNADIKLEKHHVMPIGSLGAKYKSMNKKEDKRKDGNNPYNSPLNFLYVSKKANELISNSSLKEYIEYCDTDTLKSVGIETWDEISNKEVGFQLGEAELNIFLEKRYSNFEHSLNDKFKALLNHTIKCGTGGKNS
ncbi:MAG: DUF262 domain-containing protein, partial [Lachnospiraceae bacterium]